MSPREVDDSRSAQAERRRSVMIPAFKVVVPARYASTRLPGKPLLDLGGVPMVVRVVERARQSGAEEIWVATDDERVRVAAAEHEVAVVMTHADHPTGTDRLAEVRFRTVGDISCTAPVESDADKASFDFDAFGEVIRVSTRMLDNVLDATHWPLERQAQEAANKRRVGLGYTTGDTGRPLGHCSIKRCVRSRLRR